MTRDPARIEHVLDALRSYWIERPDLRLGQIVLNALRGSSGYVDSCHAFNAEDGEFLDGLADLTRRSKR